MRNFVLLSASLTKRSVLRCLFLLAILSFAGRSHAASLSAWPLVCFSTVNLSDCTGDFTSQPKAPYFRVTDASADSPDGSVTVDYVAITSASYGRLEALVTATALGESSAPPAFIHSYARVRDTLVADLPGATGLPGTAFLQWRLTGNGSGTASAGAVSRQRVFYYAGPDRSETFRSFDVTNGPLNTIVISEPIPIVFGTPFDIRATLTPRVDLRCADASACGDDWAASGRSDFLGTALFTGFEFRDSQNRTLSDVGVTSTSGFAYNAVPEPSSGMLLAAGVLLLARYRRSLRRGRPAPDPA